MGSKHSSVDNHKNHSYWASLLYNLLPGQALPLAVFEHRLLPAATIWSGLRLWSNYFRQLPLKPGDRIILCLPPSPGFLYILLAALREGLCIALLPAIDGKGGDRAVVSDISRQINLLDARMALAPFEGSYIQKVEADGLPPESVLPTNRQKLRPNKDTDPRIRIIFRTSGTTSQTRYIALSDENIVAVLESHLPLLNLTGARILSQLPWHHPFGLILELLPGLIKKCEIIRDPNHGRDTESMIQLARDYHINYINGVPLSFSRLMQTANGQELILALQGGIVGGAAVNRKLAGFLRLSKIRVGYGQTEAAPGITLGLAGQHFPSFLGNPAGCQVRISSSGELEYKGANVCLGFIDEKGFHENAQRHSWQKSGDLVKKRKAGYFYSGRTQNTFKLANGRYFNGKYWEQKISASHRNIKQTWFTYNSAANRLKMHFFIDTKSLGTEQIEHLKEKIKEFQSNFPIKIDSCDLFDAKCIIYTPKGDSNRQKTMLGLQKKNIIDSMKF